MRFKNLARTLVLSGIISSSLATQGCAISSFTKEHLIHNPIYNLFSSSKVNKLREDVRTAINVLGYSSYSISELDEDKENLTCRITATRIGATDSIEKLYTTIVTIKYHIEELEVKCLDLGEAEYLKKGILEEIRKRDLPKLKYGEWQDLFK